MSEETAKVRAYRITGRVQGVSFRAWTRRTALEMGLHGLVQNLNDGSVEACAGGPADTLDAFERCLWRGPLAARVDGVERRDPPADLPESGFLILT